MALGTPGFSPAVSPGSDPLAGPPPSPTAMGGRTGPLSPTGLTGPSPLSSNQLPPEVLTGLVTAFDQVGSVLDAAAQIAPDKGAQVALIKDLIQQLLADLMVAGAGPSAPTNAGPAFPGGGMARGIAGTGAV